MTGDGQAGAEKNELKPWRKKEWCIPKVSAEFVARMEDVLDLYAEPKPPFCNGAGFGGRRSGASPR